MSITTEQTSNTLLQPQSVSKARKLYTAGLYLYAATCHFSISASQISLGLALIGFIIELYHGRIRVTGTSVDKPFAFLCFACFLSVFRANNPLQALTDLKTFLLILCFYLPFWYKPEQSQQKRLLTTFIVSTGIAATVVFYKHMFIFESGTRAKGFFSSPMTFGECQAMALLVIVSAIAFVKQTRHYLLLSAAAVFSCCAIVFSMVRGAWLALITGLIYIVAKKPAKVAPVCAIMALAVSGLFIGDINIRERLDGLNPASTISTGKIRIGEEQPGVSLSANYQRLLNWHRGFEMIKDRYAFGIGMNNVYDWYEKLCTDYEKEKKWVFGHMHNNFLQFLITAGPLGLIAFLWFFYELFLFVFCQTKPPENTISWLCEFGGRSILICYFVTGFFEYSFGDQEVTMMAFFLTGTCAAGRTTYNQALGQI